jgi:carotenoid cleavage dioxygenase-like enzyme
MSDSIFNSSELPPGFPEAILTVSQEEIEISQMTIEGTLPEDICGHAFILAPAGHVDSPQITGTSIVTPSKNGTPFFNGDGSIYRLDFDRPGQVFLKTKIAKTPCYYADAASKPGSKYAEYGFGDLGLARLSPWLGVRDEANTNLLPMKFKDESDRLLVAGDVGRPYEIDTDSLELVTPVGWNREWKEQLPLNLPFEMVMNTAHPYFDTRTNELFTVNFSKSLLTMVSVIFKSDSTKIPQLIKQIIEEFADFLKHPLNLRNLEITRELREIFEILKSEIAEIPASIKTFWHDLRELIEEAISGKSSQVIDELKQLLELVKQILEGLNKIDDFVDIVRWDGKGDLSQWQVKLPNGLPVKIQQTMHQIGVTQDYVLLMDTGFKVGPEQLVTKPILKNKKLEKIIRDLFDYPEASETQIYLVRRADLIAGKRSVTAKHLTIPGAVIHFLVDYENPQNQIVLHVAHSNAWDVAEWVREYDLTPSPSPARRGEPEGVPPIGMVSNPVDLHSLGRYVIDAEKGEVNSAESKAISDRDLTWATAIYAYNDRAATQKFDQIYWNSWGCWGDLLTDFVVQLYKNYPRQLSVAEVLEIAKEGRPANLVRLVTGSKEEMAIADNYQFPPGYLGNSAQFVPKKGDENSPTNGYLLCTVLFENRSQIWIFDAQNLSLGVLCKLSHPRLKFGFTTHSTWLAEIAPRTADYYIPVRQDFADLVRQQPQPIQQLFVEAVYSQYPHPPQPTGYPPIPKTLATTNRRELDIQLDILESKLPGNSLPEGLQGHVFIVGPVGSIDSGGLPYPDGDTVFNGDGMMYRLDFDRSGEVRLKSRLAKTPCYYADAATQPGTKYAKYGFRNFGIERFSRFLGARNELNTAFQPLKFSPDEPERLLVTYDGGRPYEIDTETLEVVTPVGKNSEWRPEVSLGFPFPPVLGTAHPGFDPHTKELFAVNFGRSLLNFLETVPILYDLGQFPSEVEAILEKFAAFLGEQNQVEKWFRHLYQSSLDIWKFWLRLIEKITKLEIQNFVYLIRWDGVGNLERWKLVLPDRSPIVIEQTMHQVGVTKDYIVLMDTAFKTGLEQVLNNPMPENKEIEKLLRELLTRQIEPNSKIYIVRRADLPPTSPPAPLDLTPGPSPRRRGEIGEGSNFSPFPRREGGQEVEVVALQLTIPLPAFHFFVDYDNPDGKITLHVAHPAGEDVAEWIRQYDVSPYPPHESMPPSSHGLPTEETDVSRLGRYEINGETAQLLDSKVIYDSKLTWGVALGTYCDRSGGQLENIYWQSSGFWQDLMSKFIFDLYQDFPGRAVPADEVLAIPDGGRGRPASLFRLDTKAMAIADAYEFPLVSPDGKSWDSHMMSSPQFVPRQGGDGSSIDGYIVCTAYGDRGNEFWIFDAKNLAQGPVCKLGHPDLNFSLTLHTAWLPKIDRRTATYNCPVREDYEELLKQQPQEVKDLFITEVYPHFE